MPQILHGITRTNEKNHLLSNSQISELLGKVQNNLDYLSRGNYDIPEPDCLFNTKSELIRKYKHENKYFQNQLAAEWKKEKVCRIKYLINHADLYAFVIHKSNYYNPSLKRSLSWWFPIGKTNTIHSSDKELIPNMEMDNNAKEMWQELDFKRFLSDFIQGLPTNL